MSRTVWEKTAMFEIYTMHQYRSKNTSINSYCCPLLSNAQLSGTRISSHLVWDDPILCSMLCIEQTMAQTTTKWQYNRYINLSKMALSRSSKENFSPHPILFKIVRKLFIVPDHCLPASASLESIHSHHSLTYNP